MGNANSAIERAERAPPATAHGGLRVGYRVLQIQQNSPAAAAGLVCGLDFIISANGTRLEEESDVFAKMVATAAESGAVLQLEVYNIKAASLRRVSLAPRHGKDWGGSGCLGVFIRFDTYVDAWSDVLAVDSVETGSPAAACGLQLGDWLLGGREGVFRGVSDLSAWVSERAGRSDVPLYVYNSPTDTTREVLVDLSTAVSGLGCTVLHGKLHEMPNTHTLGRTSFPDKVPQLAGASGVAVPAATAPQRPQSSPAIDGRSGTTSLTGAAPTSDTDPIEDAPPSTAKESLAPAAVHSEPRVPGETSATAVVTSGSRVQAAAGERVPPTAAAFTTVVGTTLAPTPDSDAARTVAADATAAVAAPLRFPDSRHLHPPADHRAAVPAPTAFAEPGLFVHDGSSSSSITPQGPASATSSAPIGAASFFAGSASERYGAPDTAAAAFSAASPHQHATIRGFQPAAGVPAYASTALMPTPQDEMAMSAAARPNVLKVEALGRKPTATHQPGSQFSAGTTEQAALDRGFMDSGREAYAGQWAGGTP